MYGQGTSQGSLVRYLGSWGARGDRPGEFQDPVGISADPSGRLYIADTGNNRIQVLSVMGEFLGEIGGYGWESEQFDGPVALSARNGLDVFVADYNNGRIERYDKDLHYLASFVSSIDWPEHLQFGFPLGVDISSQGELFCLDGENRRVLKLDVFGEPQLSFGDFDAGEGRLLDPRRITVSGEGLVYISDVEGGHIVVFDVHGNFLTSLGAEKLERPLGLAIYHGNILIADDAKRKIMVFRQNVLIGEFGGLGVRLEKPVDVAVWQDRIFVLDRSKCAVDIFEWISENP